MNFNIFLCLKSDDTFAARIYELDFLASSHVLENKANRHQKSSMHRCLGQKCATQVGVSERAEDKGNRRLCNYFPKKKINTHTRNWHQHVVCLSLKFTMT